MCEEWDEYTGAKLAARNPTLCRNAVYDAARSDSPYSLHHILTVFRARTALPAVWREPVFLYVEYFGPPGDYEVWIDLLHVELDEDGDVVAETDEATYGPLLLELKPDRFVQGRSYALPRLPFRTSGIHELRLSAAGDELPLVVHRIMVEGEE